MLFLHTLFIFTLYRAPVDTSPVTEGVTLFKHQLLLLLLLLLLLSSHNVCLESLGPGSNHDPGALGDSQFLD